MVVNFRVREISRGTYKVVRTSMLIKKNKIKQNNYFDIFKIYIKFPINLINLLLSL
jgi:hypothetical protein